MNARNCCGSLGSFSAAQADRETALGSQTQISLPDGVSPQLFLEEKR